MVCGVYAILAAIMESQYAEPLTENERTMRDRFAREYMKDRNGPAALIRCGYAPSYATEYAKKFLNESYTNLRIDALTQESVKMSPEQQKEKLITILMAVAESPLSKGSEKVAACAQLSKLQGLDAPIKTQTDVNLNSTGVDLSHLSVAELEQMKAKVYGPRATPVH